MSLAGRAKAASKEAPGVAEMRRILALPIHGALQPEEVEAVSAAEILPKAWQDGWRLWEPQARTILAWDGTGGAVVPLGVGRGKSLSRDLVVKHSWAQGAKRILLHVPPRVYGQVLTRDFPLSARVIGLDVPVHGLGALRKDSDGTAQEKRLRLAKSGWRGLYVMPFSLLSEEDAEEVLGRIDPDVVVVDEGHHLQEKSDSAKVRRWKVMMNERRRKLCVLSGTLTRRSIMDYFHFFSLALGEGSPLPLERWLAEVWAGVLDLEAVAPEDDHEAAVAPLLGWASDAVRLGRVPSGTVKGPLVAGKAGVQRAYRLRRSTAPGIVASDEDDLGVSLLLANAVAVPAPWSEDHAVKMSERHPPGDDVFVPAVAFAHLPPLERVNALLWAAWRPCWKTPSGDQIQDARHSYKWRYEIAAGFYNDLRWPDPADLARKRGISGHDAADVVKRSRRRHDAWNSYVGSLREFLQAGHVPGLDTPDLVGTEIRHHGARRLPEKLVQKWHRAKGMEFEGMVERERHVVRLSDWKIRRCAAWCRDLPRGEGAIVWVYNVEVGAWAYEVLKEELGEDRVLHCPAGAAGDRRLLEQGHPESNVPCDKVCVASLPAHHEGKNIQRFGHAFYLQLPREAKVMQQSLGRIHREGQRRDSVTATLCLSLDFDHHLYAAMLTDATFAHVMDDRQRVVYADYEQAPKRFPPEFLNERGFEVCASGPDAERKFREMFNVVAPTERK